MATRPGPTPQRALTIVKPLRNAGDRDQVAGLLRGYDVDLRQAGLRAEFEAIAELHYLSWFLIDGEEAGDPPLLLMEANFDGSADEFLLRMARNPEIRRRLDALYGFCMGYAAPGQSADVAARSLMLGDQPPQLYYVARPGYSVQQIEEEAALAGQVDSTVAALGAPRGRRIDHLRRIWDALGGATQQRILAAPEKAFWVRYRLRERPLLLPLSFAGFLLALGGFVTLLAVVLHACGVPLWDWLVPTPRAVETARRATWVLAIIALVVLAAWALVLMLERPKDMTLRMYLRVWRVKGWEIVKLTLLALPGAALIVGAVALIAWKGELLLIVAALLLVGVVVLAGLIVLRLVLIAVSELSDEVDPMRWTPANRRAVLARENRDGQNHFVSVTSIKPGWLRQNTLRAALWWINLLASIFYNPRGLAGIASIHFARWQILAGGRRLLFATNYDGGWAGYLGEFVTSVAWGMNAIWGNVRGFPRTFYLFADGVKDEQRFKAFARASQFETLFWYRRYPQLSLGAIRRNAELREELATLSRYLRPGAPHAPEWQLDAFLRRFWR